MSAPCKPVQIISLSSTIYPHFLVKPLNSQSMIEYNSTDKTFVVGNNPGVELPATGGPGTLVYTVTGLTLTLGAALWLIFSRRKREQN